MPDGRALSPLFGRAGLVLALALLPAPGAAQLRPLDPPSWRIFDFDGAGAVEASAGVGVFDQQRAALAGTEGRLLELGNFQAAWRSGRIALEFSGTVVRMFEDQATFAAPLDGVRQNGPGRVDAGDYRVSTSVLLTPRDAAAQALLRFGTRLPTTDNGVGLDRDQTDFFALLSGRVRRGGLRVVGEAGVGIFGTRNANHEQSDALVYSLATEYARGPVVPSLELVGHVDPFDSWTPRGNEDLRELRAGVRIGGRRWIRAQGVVGLADFSPRRGLLLSAGMAR